MAAQKHDIEISADPRYSDSDIEELAREFEPAFQVQTAKYERFGLSQYALILIFVFGAIAKGFFEQMGKDIYENVKKRLSTIISKQGKISEVEFHYNLGQKEVELKVASADGNVIASAFDEIRNTLETVEESQADTIYLEFDSTVNKWVIVSSQRRSEQKVAYTFKNVVAATLDSVTVRGRSYNVVEDALKEVAKNYAGSPLKYEHTGPRIGRIEQAWYANGKLMVNIVVFEPTDDAQREQVKKMVDLLKSGKGGGFSMGFSFDTKKL